MNWTSERTAILRSTRVKEVKPPPIELTLEEQQRVIAEFKELMKREPTEEEVETLFIEERKIKNNSGSNRG